MSATGWRNTYVDLPDFETVCRLFVDLIDRGLGAVSLSAATGPALLTFDRQEMDTRLTSYSLSAAQFAAARSDIEDSLAGHLTGVSEAAFVAVRSRQRPGWDGMETPAIAAKKFALTGSSFDISALRGAWWAKTTCKTDAFQSMSWEVAMKLDDDDEIPPATAPLFAQVTLELVGPHGVEADNGSVVFALDSADVLVAIKTLERLQASLAAYESANEPRQA